MFDPGNPESQAPFGLTRSGFSPDSILPLARHDRNGFSRLSARVKFLSIAYVFAPFSSNFLTRKLYTTAPRLVNNNLRISSYYPAGI